MRSVTSRPNLLIIWRQNTLQNFAVKHEVAHEDWKTDFKR